MSVDKFGTRLLTVWNGQVYEFEKSTVRCSSSRCPFYPCGSAKSVPSVGFYGRWCPARQMESPLQGRWVLLDE